MDASPLEAAILFILTGADDAQDLLKKPQQHQKVRYFLIFYFFSSPWKYILLFPSGSNFLELLIHLLINL